MVWEVEGHRWDAVLMSETWRPDKSEIWETHQKHVFVATKKYRHRIHQRTGHHCHDRGKPQKHQTDERVLLPLVIYGPPRGKNVQNNREAHDKQQKLHTMGAGRYDNKHGLGIMLNKMWRQKCRHRIHQRTGHHCHDRGKPQKHQTDERVLLPLGIYGPPRRKNVQNNREAHDKQQKLHTDCWRRFQC